MKKPALPTAYYPALTGLRALAALAVFCFHQRSGLPGPVSSLATAGRALQGELHLGVSVFFTLSGYLITKRYASQEFGRAAWTRYLGQRAARLLPVYAFLLSITFAGEFAKDHPPVGRWLWLYVIHLTLVKGLVEDWALSGITAAWSLTVEEGFYLLAPLVFWLGWRYGPRRAWPLLALGLAALGLALYNAAPTLGTPLFVLKATIFGRLPEFLVGAAFAWHPPRRLAGRATAGGAAGLLASLGLLAAIQVVTHKVSIDSYPGLLANNLVLPLATGWLLHGLATEPTRLSRALGAAPSQLLGRVSYCFYLLHYGVLADVLKPMLLRRLPAGWATLALLGLLTLASVALYYGLERPAYRRLRAWLGRRLAFSSAISTPSPG